MQVPVPVGKVSAVLSFDFDGTLHDPAAVPTIPVRFFETIRRLREEHGAVWGINTGRALPHVIEGLVDGNSPFLPDWVVAREREIYFLDPSGHWLPHPTWNEQCEAEIHRLFTTHRPLLNQIRDEVLAHTGAEWLELEGDPAGLIARREEDMDWIVPRVTELTRDAPELGWQRNSIWMRFGHRNFQKGSSLAAVARHFGVPSARCFAIGDSHNDFEMLDTTNAGMIACPANAVSELHHHVLAQTGYVCRASHGEGAVEALEHFFGT